MMSMEEGPTPREVGPGRFLIFCYAKHLKRSLVLDRQQLGDTHEETNVQCAIVLRDWTEEGNGQSESAS